MTAPRGSRAVGRPGGDDGSAGPLVGSDAAEIMTAEVMHAGAELAKASPADTGAADAVSVSSVRGEEARTASTSTVNEPGRTPGQADDRVADQPGYQAGPIWALWLPPAVAFLVSLWGITAPSFWRDEAATIAAIKRPLGDLIRMLGNVDAVHGAYYLMMWPIAHVLGTGALVLRLPSAVAVAVGAAAVAATGRRLISSWAGLSAGLIYAVLPVVSRYGQEARSYAMVMAVAAISTYFLVRILGAEPSRQRRWIIWYAVSIAALGILNIFGLLLVPAHAVTIALRGRRRFKDQAFRRLALGWVIAVAAGVVIASPLLVLGWMQRGQIAWLSVNTSSSGLGTVFSLSGSYMVTTAVLAVIAVALVLGTETGRQKRQANWPRRLTEMSLPWLIVPPLLLLAASAVQPVYTSRYILICVPALALIAGAAVASYGRIAGAIALLVVLIAGAPTQANQRTTAGHYDDILALDHIVAANAKPGDYVLYTNPNSESFAAAYPFGLAKLRNIALKQGPIASGTLAGTNVPIAQLKSRLSHAKRLWVIEINELQAVTTSRPSGTGRPSPQSSPTPAYPQVLGLNGLPLAAAPVMAPPWQSTNSWHERGDYLILFTRP
jgi:mannosyltransferase